MFQQDYILRQIELLAQGVAKLLFKKETSVQVFDNIIHQDGLISSSEYLRYMLQNMLQDGKINDAEDLLFETIQREPRPELLEVAVEFYQQLAQLSDEVLESHDFSREEIADGLREMTAIFEKMEEAGK